MSLWPFFASFNHFAYTYLVKLPVEAITVCVFVCKEKKKPSSFPVNYFLCALNCDSILTKISSNRLKAIVHKYGSS